MMQLKTVSVAVVALFWALCVVTTECTDADEPPLTTECTTGAACFPDGQMPFELTARDTSYYCCLERNMTAKSNRLPDETYNCSCVLDLSLPGKIENWARATRQQGRMCLRERCDSAGVTTTVSERFTYCCEDSGSNETRSEVTSFDSDKEEFIGCRCVHLPVPSPDPRAYVVPPVVTTRYNSTGETCSYDAACLVDRPSLKCQASWPSNVTFCCYGSRGMVTHNDGGDALTRCTCSDEVYGAQCQARPVAIADTVLPCQTQCANRTEGETCSDINGTVRCCPHNMAVVASQSAAGAFTSCTCQALASKVHTCSTPGETSGGSGNTTPSSSTTPLGFGGPRWSDVVLLVSAGVLGFSLAFHEHL